MAWSRKGWRCTALPEVLHTKHFHSSYLPRPVASLDRTTEGLNYLTEADQIIETTNEHFHEVELHRVRGDLFQIMGNLAGAGRSYQEAIAVAKRQSAKVFELRASTGLARLWRDQGKRDEARELLAPSTAGSLRGSTRAI